MVLSNNDGCVIAQNKEAKALLEIYMCRPWFELEQEAKKLGVVAFSSNYELYANMSNRFVATLKQFTPKLEVYSIELPIRLLANQPKSPVVNPNRR